jgi:hypothetical protein
MLGHGTLDVGRRQHRLDHARELDQGAIAGELDDAARVVGDPRLDQLLTQRLEPGVRARLVGLHQPAVADHVSGQNRCELAFDAWGHGGTPTDVAKSGQR